MVGGEASVRVRDDRERFNHGSAPGLAARVGVSGRDGPAGVGSLSKRFAYFWDDERFVIVAGPQERGKVDLALARGLTHRGDRRLVLVLPQGLEFATMQRAPWLRESVRPEIWVHADGTPEQCPPPSREATIAAVHDGPAGGDPEAELRNAMTPRHLGDRTPMVEGLVEWATTHPDLDATHRAGERSWQFRGQRVLSIMAKSGGLRVRSGVHYGTGGNDAVEIPDGTMLACSVLEAIKLQVDGGMDERRSGSVKIHKHDEHWLQAIIRRDPSLVGVEQPAFREVPAWRPSTAKPPSTRGWGRGFVDLAGVDGHGNIRIVETKLSSNSDDLLIMQGLDYYIWAHAYRDVLGGRLGAPAASRLEIHYVVGSDVAGKVHISPFIAAQAAALDDDVVWRFQTKPSPKPDCCRQVSSREIRAGTSPILDARSKPMSGRFQITRVARRDIDPPVGDSQRQAARHATGGQHEWFVAVPWIYQLLASPATRGRFLEAPDESGNQPLASAYWTPLLQLLIYSFGWARPDRGLKWWYDAGKPTDDPRLQLITQIWDSDGSLDQFAAWLWTNSNYLGQDQLEALTGWTDMSGPVEIDQQWLEHTRRTVRDDQLGSPLVGGSDPLHLAMHSTGPLYEPPMKPLLLRSRRRDRHAVLVLDSMIGWYRALATHGPTLPDIGEQSWHIDVIVKPVGHLGAFRRSRETGLWFAGRHRHHVHGV